MITISDMAVLGFLNSKMAWFYLSLVASKLQGGAFAMQSPYVLSIPVVDDILSNKQISKVVGEILSLKKSDPAANTSGLEAEIDQLVYKLYGLSAEEIKIVEGGTNA